MMFSALRNRLRVSPATVIASVALVFAMTGGAYAAKKYLITSTKQISPSVLKSLQGKAGAAGAPGAAGAQGPAGMAGPAGPGGAKGETGPAGAAGKDGVAGKDGATGKAGATGPEGKAGSPWTVGGTLPSGATETGTWWLPANGGAVQGAPISFPIPLSAAAAAEITAEHISTRPEGTKFAEECPGTVADPKAEPGALCIYVAPETTFSPGGITPPGSLEKFISEPGSGGIGQSGGILYFEKADSSKLAFGTFAVTAP